MYKIANQIIDAYDDIYATYLSKIASKRPDTYMMTAQEKAGLVDDEYALSILTKTANKINKFPIDSFDNTFLSNEMFGETYHKLPKTAAVIAANMIKDACEHFKIEPSQQVNEIAKNSNNTKIASNVYYEKDEGHYTKTDTVHTKTASEVMSTFADIETICNNYTHAQYVFATPAHVKVASVYFDKQYKEFPVEYRNKFASALQVRAKELGMTPLKGQVEKYASDNYNSYLEGHLISRKNLVEHSQAQTSSLYKIASMKNQLSPQQFSQMLAAFDKTAGLTQYYGGYLQDPYISTFGAQGESDYMWQSKTGDRKLTSQEIESVVNTKNDKIASYIGKLAAESMKKDPIAIFDSLPVDVKEIIANIHDGNL